MGTLTVQGNLKVGSGFCYLWNFGSAANERDCLVSLGTLKMETGSQGKAVASAASGASLPKGIHRWPVITAQSGVADDIAKSGAVEIDRSLGHKGFSGCLGRPTGGLI